MSQPSASRQPGASWPTVILLALAGVAATATLAVLISWRPAPASLAPARLDPGTIVVARQPYDDSRDVELAVKEGAAAKLLATASGVLTSSSCRPGAVVASGKTVATIGGRRIVPLASRVPPYRTISVGTSGADVTSLRVELTRLRSVPAGRSPSAPADADLITAARRLGGLNASSASLPPDAFAWIPGSTTKVATCDVPVGATVPAGAPLSTLSPPVVEVSISASPTDEAPGPRVLTVGSVTVKVTGRRITAAADLARLARTPEWAAYEQSAGKAPVGGQWKLKIPVQVASLPAASLFTPSGAAGGQACVSVAGRLVPVTVVASSLGRTLVTFADAWPDRVDTTPPKGFRCR